MQPKIEVLFTFCEYESPALTIHGTENHVHSLPILSRKFTVAKRIEEVKRALRNKLKPMTSFMEDSIGKTAMPRGE